jgi:hypothetical protein
MTNEHIRDVCVGAVGWFVINSLLWGAIGLMVVRMGPAAILLTPVIFLSGPANLIALVVLSIRPARRWIALGAFSALVANSIGILLSPNVDPSDILIMMPFYLSGHLGL